MKAAILLVFSYSTLVLLGVNCLLLFRRKWIYYLQGIFIRVFCLNVPSATITIETSFLVLQIEITGNFILHSFYPTALKGCWGIVFTHGVRMGGRVGGWAGGGKRVCPGCISETVRCRKLILGRDIG